MCGDRVLSVEQASVVQICRRRATLDNCMNIIPQSGPKEAHARRFNNYPLTSPKVDAAGTTYVGTSSLILSPNIAASGQILPMFRDSKSFFVDGRQTIQIARDPLASSNGEADLDHTSIIIIRRRQMQRLQLIFQRGPMAKNI